jgi:hypothetical protein
MDCASDSLSPAARLVDIPHAVLVLIPAVSDSDWLDPCDLLVSADRDEPPPNGRKLLGVERDCPLPRDSDSLPVAEVASEADSPTVLV